MSKLNLQNTEFIFNVFFFPLLPFFLLAFLAVYFSFIFIPFPYLSSSLYFLICSRVCFLISVLYNFSFTAYFHRPLSTILKFGFVSDICYRLRKTPWLGYQLIIRRTPRHGSAFKADVTYVQFTSMFLQSIVNIFVEFSRSCEANVLQYSLLWDITLRRLIFIYRCFGKTYRSYFQEYGTRRLIFMFKRPEH